MKKCDIIIPIYNAFDYLKKCIESVLLHTNLEDNQLVIIDDKSTDERIIPFIEDIITNKKQNIIFIKNESNLGFIKTVNLGMKFSKNDVLLLNTDTEVTTDWLEKIQRCAYSKERIATVTPLSNNATIASVPIFCEENEIPNGYNLEEFQNLINNVTYKEYGEIPTGIGFCFYIRREALETVGYFDEESYGRAYGEEEDFCYRCLGYGYRHILCDDVIVYHKSSQSLSNYHLKNIETRQETLLKKHPFYKLNTVRWVSNSPLIYINKNINLNLCINNNNSNILIIVDDWSIQNKTVGSTSLYIFDLIEKLKKKYNFHVFAPYNDNYKLYSYWRDGKETIEIISNISRYFTNIFYNLEYSKILQNIIESLNVDIIHIHHMKGHFFDIIDIIKIYETKLIITLYDSYDICPYKNMEIYNIKAWKNVWELLLSSASKIYEINHMETMYNEYDRIYSIYKFNNDKDEHIEKLRSFVKENCLYNIQNSYAGSDDFRLVKEMAQILASYSWRIGRIATWLPRKIRSLNNYVKYKPIFIWSLSKKIKVYDISSIEKSKFSKVIFKCGKIDPQIHFLFKKPLIKPNGNIFFELKYINALAGNLKIYYDWGIGFNENNTDIFSIEETQKTSTILMRIEKWHHGSNLTAFRIDPPDSTEFTISSLKIIKEEEYKIWKI
jgi:GT2 family glycosyltransferase